MFVITKVYEKLLEIMSKGDFSQTELLKHLALEGNKAECVHCGKNAHDIELTLHHKDHNKDNTSYKNIEIMCIPCHRKTHGIDKKDKDRI